MWWLPAVGLLALGMVMYVMSALHVLTFSPLNVGRQAAEREAMALRALEPPEPRASVRSGMFPAPTVHLQAGGHPGAPRFTIPVPRDARLPDATRGEREAPGRDRIVLVTSSDVSDILAFYRAELASDGWHEVRAWMSRPAQGIDGRGGAVSAFCREVNMPALLVGVVTTETGPSELRLLIDADQPGPCASSSEEDPWRGRPPAAF